MTTITIISSLAIQLLVVLLCHAQNKDMLKVLQLLPAISAWITISLIFYSDIRAAQHPTKEAAETSSASS